MTHSLSNFLQRNAHTSIRQGAQLPPMSVRVLAGTLGHNLGANLVRVDANQVGRLREAATTSHRTLQGAGVTSSLTRAT